MATCFVPTLSHDLTDYLPLRYQVSRARETDGVVGRANIDYIASASRTSHPVH